MSKPRRHNPHLSGTIKMDELQTTKTTSIESDNLALLKIGLLHGFFKPCLSFVSTN